MYKPNGESRSLEMPIGNDYAIRLTDLMKLSKEIDGQDLHLAEPIIEWLGRCGVIRDDRVDENS